MRPALRHHLVLTAWTLLVHGLLALNDGVYWDDWLWLQQDGRHIDWGHVLTACSQMGSPTTNRVYLWLFDALGYRSVILASVVLAGNLIYRLLRFRRFFADQEALAVAMLAVCYPSFECWVLMATGGYVFCYTVFLGAAALALLAETRRSSISRAILRVLALLLFALSFNFNSLLVFYFAFLGCLFVACSPTSERTTIRAARQFVLRKLDYLLVPVLYWIVKETWFPRSGAYADYNRFRLSPTVLVAKTGLFLVNGVYRPLNDALLEVTRRPLLAIIVVATGLPLWRIVARGGRDSAASVRLKLLVFSALTGLAIFPYVAVGLWPLEHGWSTRHTLLLGLPISGLLVALLSVKIRADGHQWLKELGICIALFGFGSNVVTNYVVLQARWVRDLSLITRLEELPQGGEFSTFVVEDQRAERRPLSFYEWSSIFKRVWGGESRIGINREGLGPDLSTSLKGFLEETSRFFVEEYNLSQYRPNARVARLRILDGTGRGLADWEIAGRYLFGRFFDKGELTKLLGGMAAVELGPWEHQ